MIFKRKIESILEKWYDNAEKTALIISGPRQIGKSVTIERFCKSRYDNILILNFLNNSKFKDIFSDGDFTEDVFVSKINLFFPEKKIEESKKFVIFFDEIQECKNAITSLKFILQFKKYKFDVICSGSYLGIVLFGNKKNESFSWPTGFTQQENMYSMDFEEFLWANGYDTLLDETKSFFYDKNKKIPDLIMNKCWELLNIYLLVGGMPSVVEEYLNNKNLLNVFNKQNSILLDYKNDVIKYAPLKLIPKIIKIIDNLCQQFQKSNNYYNFNLLGNNSRRREYEEAIEWLSLTKIISICHSIENDNPKLKPFETGTFKLYFNDVGLFLRIFNDFNYYTNNLTVASDIKGSIYENYGANLLIRKDLKLNYFFKQRKIKFEKIDDDIYKKVSFTIGTEIDFFVWKNSQLFPIEIKASNNKAKSLKIWSEKYPDSRCFKLGNINLSKNCNIETIPLWLFAKIFE